MRHQVNGVIPSYLILISGLDSYADIPRFNVNNKYLLTSLYFSQAVEELQKSIQQLFFVQIIVKRLIKIWNSQKISISLHRKTEREAKMNVRCLEQIQKGVVTFRTGETYFAEEINDNWYVVDSLGFTTEDFHLHFEAVGDELTEEEASARVGQVSHQARIGSWAEPEIPIVPGLWDDEENGIETEEEIKESLWERLMDYIFV